MFLDLIKLSNERIYNRDNCRSEGKHVYRYLKISLTLQVFRSVSTLQVFENQLISLTLQVLENQYKHY
jgi:hypothetical protein